MVAYIQSRPSIDREMEPSELGPIFSVLIATGEMPLSATTIDHKSTNVLGFGSFCTIVRGS